MKVYNKTEYDTKAIKALVSQCLAEVRKTDAVKINWFSVYYTRNSEWRQRTGSVAYASGHTVMHGRWFQINLPKLVSASVREVATVIIHEVGHCLGVPHRGTSWEGRTWTIERHYQTFLNSLTGTLPVATVQCAKPVDKVAVRKARAEKNLKTALTRFKRAQTILKKYQRQVKYYKSK